MNKQTFVTTPQGTVTLNEYGSFNEMNKQNINVSSWHEVTITNSAGLSQQVLGRAKLGYPLPSLTQINVHVKHGFAVLMDEKHQRDKHYAEEMRRIRNYNDFELLTMARVLRYRMNEYANVESSQQMNLYQAVMEEIDRRKEGKLNWLSPRLRRR